MNQTEIGKFIAKCRKGKSLTQAQLAERLNITDRAVSKWETGKSMPDSSIMLELCEILGITVNELFSGEEIGMENVQKKADENLIALQRKDESGRIRNKMLSALFSGVFLIGMMVCLICDAAISGRLTWSLIPASSIVFAWVLLFPTLAAGKRGIVLSLVSWSIFIVPYLFVLSRLTNTSGVFSIGTAMAAISTVFLWLTAAVFNRLGKTRTWMAWGITFLLAVPFLFIINIVLSKMIAEPILDLWDLLTIFVLLILAFAAFVYDIMKRKKPMK